MEIGLEHGADSRNTSLQQTTSQLVNRNNKKKKKKTF